MPAKPNVLFMDDDQKLTEIFKIQLTAKGFEVATANSAPQAKAVLLTFTPDVIVADIKMPIYDGYQFIFAMRKRDKFKDTPVIVLTGDDTPDKRSKAKAVAASLYLVKPIKVEELAQHIRAILSSQDAHRWSSSP